MANNNRDIKIKLTTEADTQGVDKMRASIEGVNTEVEKTREVGAELNKTTENFVQQNKQVALSSSELATELQNLARAEQVYIDKFREAQNAGNVDQLRDYQRIIKSVQEDIKLLSTSTDQLSLSNVTLGNGVKQAGGLIQSFTTNTSQLGGTLSNITRTVVSAAGATGTFGSSLSRLAPLVLAGGPLAIGLGVVATGVSLVTQRMAESARKSKEYENRIKELARSTEEAARAETLWANRENVTGIWRNEEEAINDVISAMERAQKLRMEDDRDRARSENNQFRLREQDIENSNLTDIEKADARYELAQERSQKEFERASRDQWDNLEVFDRNVKELSDKLELAKEESEYYQELASKILSERNYNSLLKDIEKTQEAQELAKKRAEFFLGEERKIAQEDLARYTKLLENQNQSLTDHMISTELLGLNSSEGNKALAKAREVDKKVDDLEKQLLKSFDERNNYAERLPGRENELASEKTIRDNAAKSAYERDRKAAQESERQKKIEDSRNDLTQQSEDLAAQESSLESQVKTAEEAQRILADAIKRHAETIIAKAGSDSQLANVLSTALQALDDGVINDNEFQTLNSINQQLQNSQIARTQIGQQTSQILQQILNNVVAGNAATQALQQQLNSVKAQTAANTRQTNELKRTMSLNR